ncbi:MAG: hypothetical protein J6B80_08160 [Clostridia bacterium]|nr:hypothetical protein [Clostridia bacterium]
MNFFLFESGNLTVIERAANMSEKYKDFEKEYDSLKDIIEFQNNTFNPGHYVGTGKVPPTVSAPGNATPLVVLCFVAAVLLAAFGLYLFFGNTTVTFMGLIESPIVNKIIALIIMLILSAFFTAAGFTYLKKAKKYYKLKKDMKNELIDETVEDKLWQRTCPKCGTSHDIDYPKCPNCKFDYLKR